MSNLLHRVYFGCVVGTGMIVLALSIRSIAIAPVPYVWLILASVTALAGRFPIKLPGAKSTISIADAFIFTNAILFGPAVGSVTAALEGFLGSIRYRRRRAEYSLFNVATMAGSAYLAAMMFFRLAGSGPVYAAGPTALSQIMLPVLGMSLVHYVSNTVLVAVMVAQETHRRLYKVWCDQFLWTSLNYLVGGSAAALIVINLHSFTPATLGLVMPILLITYFAYKSHLEKSEENAHRQQLDKMHLRTVEALASAIDARESGTLGDARRVQLFARSLAKAMRVDNENEYRGIEAAALLLDIGNLAVPEYILNNPGELTISEFQKVKIHPIVGASILSNIEFPYPVADYVRHHHERWDGSGYPDRLKGERIPLGSRILSVADSFAALTCDRPYQKARNKEQALLVIRSRAGTYYDPEVVRTFEGIVDDVIKELHRNGVTEPSGPHPPNVHDAGDLGAFHEISLTRKEATALFELTQALGTTLSLSECLTIVAENVSRVVEFTTGVIYLHQEEQERLVARHVCGANSEQLRNYALDVGKSLSGWVVERKEPVINAGATRDLSAIHQDLPVWLENALVYPLVTNHRCLGTLSLYSIEGHKFRPDDLRVVAAVAEKAAAAIENARRFEEAREEAVTDPLTCLPNMRFLRQAFEIELSKAKRHLTPICVLGMDLDGFKAVNDQYGHHVGDRMLLEVASLLKNMLRAEDIVVRNGGDEFVAALVQTARDDAYRLIGRIQKAIDDLRLEVAPGEHAQIGISIGCSCYPEDGDSLEELLRKADCGMYRDKDARRAAASRLAARIV
jgi:diguanylate cyclase (GGDEF)-like protein